MNGVNADAKSISKTLPSSTSGTSVDGRSASRCSAVSRGVSANPAVRLAAHERSATRIRQRVPPPATASAIGPAASFAAAEARDTQHTFRARGESGRCSIARVHQAARSVSSGS
ncbi:MAG: hypothetical protein FJ256_03920 [Phycisphaerae bacterium]|nr:hypothetical protein [Phycisphaerae bacterium]